MDIQPQNVQVPKEAKFVIYQFPGTGTPVQQTLGIHSDPTRESIKNVAAESAYAVIFKDKEHTILPKTYIIKWEVKNVEDLNTEENMDDAFEESIASQALSGTGLRTYIKLETKEIYSCIAFDPETMVLVGEDEQKERTPDVPYTPLKIPTDFGALRREEACFSEQKNRKESNIGEQPFISRSWERSSIDFVLEYYRYCCNPTAYPGSKLRDMPYWQERFPITPEVLKNMEDRIGASLTDLKVCPFFEKEWYTWSYMPTHDLLCHMFLMNRWASVPGYLARGHLWDSEKASERFTYYTNFLIHNQPNIIPNQAWAIAFLKRIVTIIKNGPPARLMEIEIDVKDIMDLLSKWPYEDLFREQWRLVDNITEWDTIWFKLTPTGAMFLYLCCPNIL